MCAETLCGGRVQNMFVVDLQCDREHHFEGWYDSREDYFARSQQHEISCPVCGSLELHRVPSATRLQTACFGDIPHTMPTSKHVHATLPSTIPLETQKALSRILQRIRKTHQDVGDQFAERATAMSQGAEPSAAILGSCSHEEERQMDAEGVPYFKIPVPDIESN